MKLFLISAAVLFLAPSADAQLTRIGAAAAVRGRVEAVAPTAGAVGRIMSSGKEVYLRDAVTTDSQGRMQVMLLDETVFTIGPNSSLVLDEFVYDPNTGAGKMTARVTKGVFRFVTGKIARETPSNMKVKLPVGVIGIRGTIVMGKIFSPTSALAILMGPGARNNANERPGQMVVSAGGKDSVASKPGSGIDVTPAGPSAPYAVPQAKVDEVSGDLAPKTSDAPAKGADSSGGTASSTEGSATEESGQTTAGALNDLSTSQSVAEATTDNSNITENASQSGTGSSIADGISKWDDIRTAGSGVGHFNQTSGPFGSCSGGSCSGPLIAVACLYIDFNNRYITNGSYVWIYDQASGGSFLSDSVDFSGNHSFASLSGDATLTFGGGGPNYSCAGAGNGGCSFSGTSLTFINSGGEVAKQMKVDINYSDSNTGPMSASGTTTFTR